MPNEGPGGRIARGDAIKEAASTTKLGALAKRFAAFSAVHGRYVAAARDVEQRAEALEAQEAKCGAADAHQDAAVDALASALAGDGFPRINPFRPLGFVSPSDLKKLGYEAEADEALRLVEAVGKHPRASKASKQAAAALGKAARAVKAALAPIDKLTKARTDAITRRDAVGQPWEAALAALKLGAASAELDGQRGVVAILFGGTKPAAPKKRKPKPTPTPVTPPTARMG